MLETLKEKYSTAPALRLLIVYRLYKYRSNAIWCVSAFMVVDFKSIRYDVISATGSWGLEEVNLS